MSPVILPPALHAIHLQDWDCSLNTRLSLGTGNRLLDHDNRVPGNIEAPERCFFMCTVRIVACLGLCVASVSTGECQDRIQVLRVEDATSAEELLYGGESSDHIEQFPTQPDLSGARPGSREDSRKTESARDHSATSAASLITRSIRRQLAERADLSSHAQNVRIIIEPDGTVTLRGPVENREEHREIEQIARTFAASGKVHNQMVVMRRDETASGDMHG